MQIVRIELRQSLPTFGASHMRKIPGSLHLYNFNVCILEHGTLGTRLDCYLTSFVVGMMDLVRAR